MILVKLYVLIAIKKIIITAIAPNYQTSVGFGNFCTDN